MTRGSGSEANFERQKSRQDGLWGRDSMECMEELSIWSMLFMSTHAGKESAKSE